MMNTCTDLLDIGWIILSEQPTCKTILPKFISIENNLTDTIIIYYMDGSDQWHTMYKTKLVIPSTQTDILPQHNFFLKNFIGSLTTIFTIIIPTNTWAKIHSFKITTTKEPNWEKCERDSKSHAGHFP